jgi:hypothetical protein
MSVADLEPPASVSLRTRLPEKYTRLRSGAVRAVIVIAFAEKAGSDLSPAIDCALAAVATVKDRETAIRGSRIQWSVNWGSIESKTGRKSPDEEDQFP